MKILMVSAEYAPLAKTGGLADAVAGLSAALARRGHDVRVLMPSYGRPLPETYRALPAESTDGFSCTPALPRDGGPSVCMLGSPEIGADGEIYAGDDRDAARFWAFNRGALAISRASDWRPDVVHCHDWHASLVPALAKLTDGSPPARAASVLTLHNVGYQGAFPRDALPPEGRDALAALDDDETRRRDYVIFLDVGIRYADAVTTVSPTYAREVTTPEQGMGLDALLRRRGAALVGILNGVDYTLWSPESDPFIEPQYGLEGLDGKRRVKLGLCRELGLSNDAPLIGAVTRLVEQKGIDLLVDALPALLERTSARFALLGSGDTDLETALTGFAKAHPERLAFRCGYDEALAHRIIAGSDLLVVPSRYEPCGLTQLYAMRYGTIPIVRKTGGLADTVVHFDPRSLAGTGSVFEHADVHGLIWATTTALVWYENAEVWRRVMRNAMSSDFSWARQAEPYEALYGTLLASADR